MLGESPNLAIITSDLGTRWEIATNTYKPYPCGVVIHPIIEGCVTLAAQHDVDPATVEAITLRCNPLVIELCGKKTPRDTLEAKLSVFHSAAASVIARRMGELEYNAAFVNKPEVTALRDKVSVTVDAAIREDETDVTLHLHGGKTLNTHIDHVIGSEHKPMSDRDMAEKFRVLVEPVLPKDRIAPLIDACWNLNKLDDVSTLARLAAAD